jgi:hypothetical protein
MVRHIGMDVHREFAQLAVLEDGLIRDEGKIGVTPEALRAWADGLRADDQVALEATGTVTRSRTCCHRWSVGSWCPTRPRPARSPRRR